MVKTFSIGVYHPVTDGIPSGVRAQVAPELQPIYAGYYIWRGAPNEADLAPQTLREIFSYFTFYLPEQQQVITYPIAGFNNDLRPGHRRPQHRANGGRERLSRPRADDPGRVDQLEKLFKGNAKVKPAAVENEPLIIGGSYSPSAILLPSVLQTFVKRHPDVRPQLQIGSRAKIAQLVAKSKIDIAVINDPPELAQVVAEPYRWEKMALFVPAKHPLAKKSKLELGDILRFPLVIGAAKTANSTLARTISRAVEQAGVRVGLHCNSPMGVKAAVRRGIGVGVLYEDTVRHEISDGEFKLLKFPGSATWGCFSHIVYHRERPLSPAAKNFLAILHEKKTSGKKAYSSPKSLEVTFPAAPRDT